MERQVAWESADGVGTEQLTVSFEDGVAADAVTVGVRDDPFSVAYHVRCDEFDRVRSVRAERLDGTDEIELEHDGEGNWTDGSDEPVSALTDCLDVDVSVTPFTNTIPIRRLEFEVGESHALKVAYLDALRMTVRSVDQRYTCLRSLDDDGGRFRYENVESGFTAELPVDSDGVVLDYPGIFRRAFP
ncbi:putative glycolipid-binding domain-containing protein [Halorussus salinisoli]|uniref:putative glycolipid-binding domain-containing protein n=1 Tax=Halorussus salinisoli TaxID=2558242 RepID=UPI0010C1A987|nr:putative glycolipid-binding domain-containing protein [Halorussus salinisoli]